MKLPFFLILAVIRVIRVILFKLRYSLNLREVLRIKKLLAARQHSEGLSHRDAEVGKARMRCQIIDFLFAQRPCGLAFSDLCVSVSLWPIPPMIDEFAVG